MIAKRIAAGLLTIVLILGAWVVRDRVIDDDGANADSGDNGDDNDDDRGEILYCLAELGPTCEALRDQYESLDVRVMPAGTTLELSSGDDSERAMWLTVSPLPDMLGELRRSRNLEPIEYDTTPLATSSLALVVRPDDRSHVVATCGDPVDLACLSELASLRPTFAALDSASGMLGIAAAASAFGGESLDLNDPQFAVWAQTLKRASTAQLSGGTAIQTIQTRPSFGIAIGAIAELTDARRPDFEVMAPAQPVGLAVVLAVPDATEPPAGLAGAATASLMGAGWDAPTLDATSTGLPDPGVILRVRDFWEDLR
jgi:hypothetical protein